MPLSPLAPVCHDIAMLLLMLRHAMSDTITLSLMMLRHAIILRCRHAAASVTFVDIATSAQLACRY